MPARRRLTDGELALWERAVQDAKPLHGGERRGKAKEASPAEAPAEPSRADKPQTAGAGVKTPAPWRSRHIDHQRPIDIDRRSWQRLRRGQLPIEGRLDLHGLTQAEAHARLGRFLAAKQKEGARCVLVITGRGGAGRSGVLRQMTPRWLDEPPNRERVVAYAWAQMRDGGDGALYVLLRRRRA